MTEQKLPIQIAAEKYNKLFRDDETLDEVIQRYIQYKITKADVLFYMYWNQFDTSDIDWNLVESKRKEILI